MVKVQLELGGKNPAIVFDCDDLDEAAREIVAAAFLCSGQRCTALSRVLVEESLADDLVERLRLRILNIRIGNGLDPDTTMGPLVSREQMETVVLCEHGTRGRGYSFWEDIHWSKTLSRRAISTPPHSLIMFRRTLRWPSRKSLGRYCR